MSVDNDCRAYRVQLISAIGCLVLGVISIAGEVVCRLYHIDTPLSFTTLTAVAITALARGVPSMAANGKNGADHRRSAANLP